MTAYDIYEATKFDIEEKYGNTLDSTDKLLQVKEDVQAIGEGALDIRIASETAIAVAMAFIDYAKACEGELEDAGFKDGEWEANYYNLVEGPLTEIPAREGYILTESGREIPFVTARMQMDDSLYAKACDGHYGLMDKDGAVETTERIDFRQLYYSENEGPVYKGYPIRAFIKGPWNPAWDEK